MSEVFVEKCPCGHKSCTRHWVSNMASYEGSGWDSAEEAQLVADAFNNAAELTTLRAQNALLAGFVAIFLGHDERFQVAVGGNPNAVETMLDDARNTLAQVAK